MIFEMRTYTLQPGSVPEVEKRWTEALTERVKVSPLGAFFHTEVGHSTASSTSGPMTTSNTAPGCASQSIRLAAEGSGIHR